MIQRIQSLYLLLVSGLMTALAVLPVGLLTGDDIQVKVGAFGFTVLQGSFQSSFPVWVMGALAVLSAFVAFITIFLYKKRSFQTTLCTFNGVLMVLFAVSYGVFYLVGLKGVDLDFSLNATVVLPVVGLVFNIMATKAITKDIELLSSLNRLR
jgi:Domain of unknown function (DUF4293)